MDIFMDNSWLHVWEYKKTRSAFLFKRSLEYTFLVSIYQLMFTYYSEYEAPYGHSDCCHRGVSENPFIQNSTP